MTEVVYPFKRGDDFVIPMTLQDSDQNPVDITGWTISSAVTYARKAVSTLDCTITDGPNGAFTIALPRAQTALWPVRKLKCDVQFDRPVEGRVSSKTFIIEVEEDHTP
ncbi:hypothetical protein [Sulfitobacter phage vB_SupP_AX]|nr:hypothetical protein [Sulfitobacter phage vB_SupP_AX]